MRLLRRLHRVGHRLPVRLRSPERARYLSRAGRGPGGQRPPNDWQSVFGGPAWTRVREADGRPGQWSNRRERGAAPAGEPVVT